MQWLAVFALLLLASVSLRAISGELVKSHDSILVQQNRVRRERKTTTLMSAQV